ncbi:MAG: methyltransferase domain-containing protein [Puniceicoccales bacterium]|nr:methyltransferase domain-containing protein [Puniceicoccales bacterium]
MNRLSNNFDEASASYDQHASVQKKTSEHLAYLCSSLPEKPKKILDIGCGTGFTTLALQKYYRNATYTLCDLSKNMILSAKNKIPNQIYIVGDAENYTFNDTYDLGISNLALQWFENIESFLSGILLQCKYFAFSIPIEGSFAAYKNLFAEKNIPILAHHYWNIDALLALAKKQGDVIRSDFKRYDLFFENALGAAKHFKSIGAQGMTTPQNKIKIAARLLANPVEINLNYDIFFTVLWKK